jgi:hypothetical protein
MMSRCSPVKRRRLSHGCNEYIFCALVGGRRTLESRNLRRKVILPGLGEREVDLPWSENNSIAY